MARFEDIKRKMQISGAVFFGTLIIVLMITGLKVTGTDDFCNNTPGTGITPASDRWTSPPTEITDLIIQVTTTPQFEQDKQYYNIPLNEATQDYIFSLSEEYGVPEKLIIAIIFKESSYRPTATGSAGEQGYMQIHPINFDRLQRELGITDFYDPEQNILAGTFMLSELFQKYETVNEVLMCYNCGETGAKKLWKQGITQTEYCQKIEAIMQGLEKE